MMTPASLLTTRQNQRSPPRPRSPPPENFARASTPPLPSYEYLSSPVPDLAATLHTRAADEADAANVSFLRDSLEELNQLAFSATERSSTITTTLIDPRRDPRRRRGGTARTENGDPQQQETAEDLSRRDRLQRVLARLNRLHEPPAPSTSAYSNRTPSPHRQSIYDWAPSSADDGGSRQPTAEERGNLFDTILDDLRQQQRWRQPDTQHQHPDLLRVLSRSQRQVDGRALRQASSQSEGSAAIREGNGTPPPPPPRTEEELAERRERLRERERRRRETEWVSLRTRAAIQRSRQEGSPSATDRMLRHVMERERSGMSEEEERARGAGWLRADDGSSLSRNSLLLPPPASNSGNVRNRDRQERVDSFRRGYLPENVPPRLPRISSPTVPSSVSGTTATAAAASPGRSSTAFLESALKYLGELRGCTSYEEALSTAIDHGFAIKEFFSDKHDDFIMDVSAVDPLPYSSWLQPGTVFEGHQHATNVSCSYNPLVRAGSNGTVMHAVEQINPNFSSHTPASGSSWGGFDHPPGSTHVVPQPAFDAARPYQFTLPTTASLSPAASSKPSPVNPDHDQWPVRVIIHAIDPDRMTLQGTMEAYDVPQHPAPPLSILHPSSTAIERPKAGKKHAPITTYLEGHIIDLKTHSFLTPPPPDEQKPTASHQPPRHHSRTDSRSLRTDISFPAATPQVDAQNWLKLPPFCNLPSPSSLSSSSSSSSTADDTARLLLSHARTRALWDDYIFMRWKERCFVHSPDDTCPADARGGDQDRGHGLTISGFYYISLRRCDGRVEGLYFDPASTPYQHLRLRGRAGGWPSFEMR